VAAIPATHWLVHASAGGADMATQDPMPLADDAAIQRTVEALRARNIETVVVESGAAAKARLIEMVPEGAELFNNTSETLDAIGYTAYVSHNPRYKNLHDAMVAATDPVHQRELRRLSTVAEYFIGSVQAITEAGEVLIASSTGSQIGAYVYGARYVIWVVGTQKICPTLADAMARVRGYTLERHDQWLEAMGRAATPIGKLAIVEKEAVPGRIRLILIKESLGW
jgi:hypothetical protein